MNKQKGPTPTDPSIKKPKIRKLETPKCTKTQSQGQPISELLARTQRIDPTANDHLDELVQIWNDVKDNSITLSQDQVEFDEMEKSVAQIELENKNLQDKITKRKEQNEKTSKYIAQLCEAREKIIEKQILAADLGSVIREHIIALTDEVEQTEQSLQHLEGLYECVISKGQETQKCLAKEFNDLVSKAEKEFKAKFDLKCEELMIVKTKCEEIENEIKKKTEMNEEANRKLEVSKALIETKEKEYNEGIAKELETKIILEENSRKAQEENSKIDAEYYEISKMNKELFLKFEALKVEDTGLTSELEFLKSSLVEQKEQERKLNNEFDEVKEAHRASVSNRDLESAEYKKELQDFIQKQAEATENLKEALLNNDGLLKACAEAVKRKELLEESLENRDNETKKLGTELNAATDTNKELLGILKNLKAELIVSENLLSQLEADYKTRKSVRDENIEKKAAAERLLSVKSDEVVKAMEEAEEKKDESSKALKKLEEDIHKKKCQIIREKKTLDDLRSEKKEKQSEIRKTMTMPKKCHSSEHAKQIQEQKQEIEALNQELWAEKLNLRQMTLKKKDADNKEKEKRKGEVKKNESHCDDLQKKLAAVDQEIRDTKEELEAVEASNAAKNARKSSNTNQLMQSTDADREAIPRVPTRKSILKLGAKDSPKIVTVQKVQFDMGSLSQPLLQKNELSTEVRKAEGHDAASPNKPDWAKIGIATSRATVGKIDFAVVFDEARRQYAATGNKPNWGRIAPPTGLHQQETRSPAVDAIPKTQAYKSIAEWREQDNPSVHRAQVEAVSSPQSHLEETGLSDAPPKQAAPKKFFKSRDRIVKSRRFTKK